jgi:hypothetical protein
MSTWKTVRMELSGSTFPACRRSAALVVLVVNDHVVLAAERAVGRELF